MALTRRELPAHDARRAAKGGRPAMPRHLHVIRVTPSEVSFGWHHVHAHGHPVSYEVFRGSRRVATVPHAGFTDRGLRPSSTYRYSVRAVAAHHHSQRSHALVVKTSALPGRGGGGTAPGASPGSGGAAAAGAGAQPVAPPPVTMTGAMVARMFWRAGFGPSVADLTAWTGRQPSELVDHFLTTPNSLTPTSTPPTFQNNPIDPLASDQELIMEWLDVMQRSTNPFVERMTFFWHRHFAVSRSDAIPNNALVAYRDRLRSYSDFSANPTASFRNLALDMTTLDAAMCQYLTSYLNVKGAPNENYAREFMELFTLGVTDGAGNPNYSQADVHALARAFTGYNFHYSTAQVYFTPSNHDAGSKTILGQTGTFDAPAAVNVVLSQAAHAPFLVRKLWSEFIAAPIPVDVLSSLVSTYTAGGTLSLQPLLRGILNHPLIFDSLDEPNMIKPPVVFTVGVLRALGAPLKDNWQYAALNNMQQQPYFPPNVAGWEGGLSWMTTGTSQARFDLIVRCQQLLPTVPDIPAETPQEAFDRAYAACGSPWLSDATRQSLLSYAQSAPTSTAARRRERQYALQALILGGPDGQVM